MRTFFPDVHGCRKTPCRNEGTCSNTPGSFLLTHYLHCNLQYLAYILYTLSTFSWYSNTKPTHWIVFSWQAIICFISWCHPLSLYYLPYFHLGNKTGVLTKCFLHFMQDILRNDTLPFSHQNLKVLPLQPCMPQCKTKGGGGVTCNFFTLYTNYLHCG